VGCRRRVTALAVSVDRSLGIPHGDRGVAMLLALDAAPTSPAARPAVWLGIAWDPNALRKPFFRIRDVTLKWMAPSLSKVLMRGFQKCLRSNLLHLLSEPVR
jgi:hypothetical protein